jgi:hypothetical protein
VNYYLNIVSATVTLRVPCCIAACFHTNRRCFSHHCRSHPSIRPLQQPLFFSAPPWHMPSMCVRSFPRQSNQDASHYSVSRNLPTPCASSSSSYLSSVAQRLSMSPSINKVLVTPHATETLIHFLNSPLVPNVSTNEFTVVKNQNFKLLLSLS